MSDLKTAKLEQYANCVLKDAARIEDLEQKLEKCKAVLRPFTQDDLCKSTSSTIQGDNSPVFGRDKAMLTLGDFRKARTLLKELES